MNYSIILYESTFSTHEISDKISNLITPNGKFINPVFKLFSFCCLDDSNRKIIFYNNQSSNYCLFFDHKLKEAFYFFINEFFFKKEINIYLSYYLLLIAEEINNNIDYVFKILTLMDFPSGEKGYSYFKSMKSFSTLLREKVLNKKMGLSEAYLFHNYFKEAYDELLLKFPYDLSFSELSTIARYLVEYSKKEKVGIDGLLNTIKENIDDNITDKKQLIDLIYNMRFPELNKLKKNIDNYIFSLDMPKAVGIEYDEAFEREDYKIVMRFNSLNSLSKKLELTKSVIEKKAAGIGQNDLFIYQNLFKKNNE